MDIDPYVAVPTQGEVSNGSVKELRFKVREVCVTKAKEFVSDPTEKTFKNLEGFLSLSCHDVVNVKLEEIKLLPSTSASDNEMLSYVLAELHKMNKCDSLSVCCLDVVDVKIEDIEVLYDVLDELCKIDKSDSNLFVVIDNISKAWENTFTEEENALIEAEQRNSCQCARCTREGSNTFFAPMG